MHQDNAPMNEVSPSHNALIPGKSYLVTPILIYTNIAVFIAMVIFGVDPLSPDTEKILQWGANFRPETLNGGWWRLLASGFLHFGVMHLLLNMAALAQMGSILEPETGSFRFLLIYLLSLLGGSVASLYWHNYAVSAGASGAVFGLNGLYCALFSAKIIAVGNKQKEWGAMLGFMAINLAAGYFLNFDNAAHIGGLLTGYFAGRIFIPSISDRSNKSLLVQYSFGLAVGFATLAVITCYTITDPMPLYKKHMERFSILEKSGLEIYQLAEQNEMDKETLLYEINDRGIYYWNEALKVLEEIDRLDMPEPAMEHNMHLKRYCNLRIRAFELMHRSIAEETHKYDDQVKEYNRQIGQLIQKLSQH